MEICFSLLKDPRKPRSPAQTSSPSSVRNRSRSSKKLLASSTTIRMESSPPPTSKPPSPCVFSSTSPSARLSTSAALHKSRSSYGHDSYGIHIMLHHPMVLDPAEQSCSSGRKVIGQLPNKCSYPVITHILKVTFTATVSSCSYS